MATTKIKLKLKEMPKELDDYFKSQPNQRSITVYRNNLKRMSKMLYSEIYFDPKRFLKNHETLIALLTTSKSRSNCLYALVKAYETLKIPIHEYHDIIKKMKSWKVIKKEATQYEIDNYLCHDELIEIREQYHDIYKKQPNKHNMFYYVLMCWYSYIPPLRQSEICNSKFVHWPVLDNESKQLQYWEEKKYENVIDLTNKNLMIYTQKSNEKYLKYRILPLPKEFVEILKVYNKTYGAQYGLCLQENTSEPNKSNNIRDTLNIIFKCKLSVDQLRSMYISEYAPFMTDEQRCELAFYMGHQQFTSELVYKRYPPELFVS